LLKNEIKDEILIIRKLRIESSEINEISKIKIGSS
jgi:hypothetical protein